VRRVAILGSTGSIGRSALAVAEAHPDRVQVVTLAAGENAAMLADQTLRHSPRLVGVASSRAGDELKQRLGPRLRSPVIEGPEGLIAAATHPDVDLVLCATSGTMALEAVLAAIEARKALALANKEVLVTAGRLMIDAAARRGVRILPVDSEHNAIHQCLHGRAASEVRRIVLTASGGPFRLLSDAELRSVTPEAALRHPTWQMGRKITIDSATLMNKGLEVIEAHWLFGVAPGQIDVVIHPQSVVHSLVELRDGSVIAQLGVTDMRLPIQYAFSYPERWDAVLPALEISRLGTLEFLPPDVARFRCLRLAYAALEAGGAAPVVLNAANEVAVEAFLSGGLPFLEIPAAIEEALAAASREVPAPRDLAEVRTVDAWARRHADATIRTLRSS
jgi:1-deoxy-D-xylulose-5-phosphate reductoisomerase